jgi:hypothetical protein
MMAIGMKKEEILLELIIIIKKEKNISFFLKKERQKREMAASSTRKKSSFDKILERHLFDSRLSSDKRAALASVLTLRLHKEPNQSISFEYTTIHALFNSFYFGIQTKEEFAELKRSKINELFGKIISFITKYNDHQNPNVQYAVTRIAKFSLKCCVMVRVDDGSLKVQPVFSEKQRERIKTLIEVETV